MAAPMAKLLQKFGGGLGLVARRYKSSHSVTNLWKLGKLNHVAIAVPDLEKAASMYRDVLGATVSETVPLPDHGVYTIFIELGNTKLELLHPLGDKSPIQAFLDKKPEGGMHHICIEYKCECLERTPKISKAKQAHIWKDAEEGIQGLIFDGL